MNYAAILEKKFPPSKWLSNADIDSWPSENRPTEDEVKQYWEEIKDEYYLDKIRNIRNILLKESDKYSLIDWPHINENIKNGWFNYRKYLRDLPSIYSKKMVGDYSFIGEVLFVNDLSYNFFPILDLSSENVFKLSIYDNMS